MNNPPPSHDDIRQLFKRLVPEVAAGVVEIVSIAREPGKLLMMAVRGGDEPGHCVSVFTGPRGKEIRRELGEPLIIVRWDESPEKLIFYTLAGGFSAGPRKPTVTLDASRRRAVLKVDQKAMEKLTAEDNLKPRLASELVGWEIELMSWE